MAHTVGSNLDFGNVARIVNLPNASAAQEPTTLAQVQALTEGLAWKDDVRVAPTGNINLSAPGATLDGVTMVAGDRFLAANQTTGSQNGIYIWNGAASAATRSLDASTGAELRGARVVVVEGTNANVTYQQTAIVTTIGTDTVTFTAAATSAPSASETTAGIAEIATQAETDAGTADNVIVTPLKLKSSSLIAKMGTALIGDGSATQYDITHNFGTRKCVVEVYRNATPWDTVLVDVERPDTNTVRIRFAAAPTTNQFEVVILAKP